MFGIETRKRRRGRLTPLLILAPLIGVGAYLVYSKAKTAKAPQYDPTWQVPEPLPHVPRSETATPASTAAGNGDLTSTIERPAESNEFAVTSKAALLFDKAIVDLNNEPVGKVEAVYYRSLSGEPEWLATSIGMVDPKRVLVPLDGATIEEEVRLAQAKADIENAPVIEAQELDEDMDIAVHGHYGVRRLLPGAERERNDENLRLRMWVPATTTTSQLDTTVTPQQEKSVTTQED